MFRRTVGSFAFLVGLFSFSNHAVAINQTYQLYQSGGDYYLKTDPIFVPIFRRITIFIPVYANGEILKLVEGSSSWSVESITFSEFNSANPELLTSGLIEYGDLDGDGEPDIELMLSASQFVSMVFNGDVDPAFTIVNSNASSDNDDIIDPVMQDTMSYTYDALGRLTFVEDAMNGNRDYDYDPAGNRTVTVVGNATDEENDIEPPPPNCADVIDHSPVFPCLSSTTWSYAEHQYCTSIQTTYGCVW